MRAGITVLAVLAPLTAGAIGSPAQAAVARPAGLDSQAGATAVELSWKPVRGATAYHVQVATSSSFDAPVMDVQTVNTHATPTSVVPPGKVFWRVSAAKDGRWSKWSSGRFSQARRSGPVLSEPENGTEFRQSVKPPVLRWDPVPGAEAYSVEIDRGDVDVDWVDTKSYTTETTSLVPTETQEPGAYSWRVRADFGAGISSAASEARSYLIEAMPAVQLDDAQDADPDGVTDVALSWDPVPGAVDYEVRVSTDDDFNVITDHEYVSGTRYSPPTTYDNASYWWQVRARDVFGQTEEWTSPDTQTGEFRRTWPDKATLVTPRTGSTVGDDLSFQWTPVPHAAWYLLDVGPEPGFTQGFETCKTTQTTFTPGWYIRYRPTTRDCLPNKAGQWYWRVRAIDSNGSTTKTVNGRFSDVGSFTWDPPAPASGSLGEATGRRLALDGNGPTCTEAFATGGVCSDISATPVLDWAPAPGATSYLIYLAHDRNFTNMVEGYGDVGDPATLYRTTNTRFSPPNALPDTQAGEAYYWFVRPCDSTGLCGMTPEEATNAFQKKSPAVDLVAPADGATIADQVRFDWTDYAETNRATTDPATGGRPTQTGRSYRIQVSQSESFAATRENKVYEEVVDQTTFTAFEDSYPEGALWWRVQAIDGSGNGLTWSEPRSFVKASPTPTVVGPTEGQTVNGVQPFRWTPLAFAKYYDLEAYRNADTAASPGNLALRVTNIRQAAYTAPKPLQALGQDFVWRVRRTDHDGHAGAWSPWHRFHVAAAPSKLLSPGKKVSAARGVFAWKASPQAAYYRWEIRRGSSLEQYAETANTRYAPTRALTKGKHTWRVVSYDSERHVLRSTKWRKVRVR